MKMSLGAADGRSNILGALTRAEVIIQATKRLAG